MIASATAEKASTRALVLSRILAIAAVVLVVATGIALTLDALPRVTAPLAWSHDGFNGGIWGVHGRAFREGPLESRLGARSGSTGHVYVNHPPLINAAVAAGQAVFDDEPSSGRGVVFLSTWAFLFGLVVLAVVIGCDPLVAAGVVAFVAATPMVRVYGTMVDTPMLSLGIATWLLIVDALRVRRRTPAWLVALAILIACLASWQAILLAGLVVVANAWRAARHKESWMYVGVLASVGALAVAGIMVWHATVLDWQHLLDNLVYRSGTDQLIGTSHVWDRQITFLSDLLPASALVAIVGLVIAVRGARTRAPALFATLAVVVYAVVMRNGAFIHDYWNYWTVLPVGIGVLVLGDSVVKLGRTPMSRTALATGVTVVLLVAAVMGWREPSAAETAINATYGFGHTLAATVWPPKSVQDVVPVFGLGSLEPAVRYYSDRPVLTVASREDMASVLSSMEDNEFVVVAVDPHPMMILPARDARRLLEAADA